MKMSMLTRELLQKWRNLIAEIEVADFSVLQMEKGKKLLSDMRNIHNKIALATLSMDKHMLAVTGRQGAGKTTFIKTLYNLDNTYLPENLSRGEQLPVLITESNISAPIGRVWRASNEDGVGISIKCCKLSNSEFKEIAMNPSEQDVWLELLVPNKYFFDDKISLVLLPGFENDRHQRSQELLLHMLRLSISSIIVFNKEVYARESNDRVFNEIKNIFKETKPIFLLSHGDVVPEQNEVIKQQLINDFGIELAEEDRIIFSGGAGFKENWNESVQAVMVKYGISSAISERKKREMLEVLFNEVCTQILTLQELLKDEEEIYKNKYGEGQLKTSQSRLLLQFSELCENDLKYLEDEIKMALQARTKLAKKHFNDYIYKNKGLIDTVTSVFSANDLRERQKLLDAIEDAWNNAQNIAPEQVIIDTVAGYIDQKSKTLGNPLLIQDSIMSKLQEQSNENVVVKSTSVTSIQRINSYFEQTSDDSKIITLGRDELRTMTLIGILLCRQAMIAQPLLDELKELDVNGNFNSQSVDKSTMDKTIKKMQGLAENLKKMESVTLSVLKSIPIILGVDAIIDGENDVLNNASKALSGLGVTILPVHLMSILGAAFLFTYGINAVQQAVNETNKRQLKISYAGECAIDGLPEMQARAFVESLRRIFGKMSEQLIETHYRKIGKFEQCDSIEKVQYHLRSIRKLNAELRKAVIDYETIFI